MVSFSYILRITSKIMRIQYAYLYISTRIVIRRRMMRVSS